MCNITEVFDFHDKIYLRNCLNNIIDISVNISIGQVTPEILDSCHLSTNVTCVTIILILCNDVTRRVSYTKIINNFIKQCFLCLTVEVLLICTGRHF